jgi:putative ABC transport system ATP-binding protein
MSSVSKQYNSGAMPIMALNNVTLTIETGEFVVVLGPSGSGKTTLLNLIGGLETPDSGQICIEGQDIAHLSETALGHYRRHKVGLVFQFFNLVDSLTALENVALAADLVNGQHISPKKVLDWVGLGDKIDRYPGQLSGGQQQRVAIARALSKNPSLVLCDEPTGSLDSRTGREILMLMRKLNRENKQTFIIVTHNATIATIADRVIRLHDGSVAEMRLNANPVDPDQLEW